MFTKFLIYLRKDLPFGFRCYYLEPTGPVPPLQGTAGGISLVEANFLVSINEESSSGHVMKEF